MDEVVYFFKHLFDTTGFPPRWHCGQWSDFHGWLYIISDLLIWTAYFAIPLLIVRYITKRKGEGLRFHRIYLLFACFILACGSTHLIDAVIFWHPIYRISAVVRLITGIISWITVYNMMRLLPTAFSLKSATQLEDEVTLRKLAEEKLTDQNRELKESQQMAKVGTWHWDVNQNEVSWSEEAYNIWNIPPGTRVTYESYIETLHPEDRNFMIDAIGGALEKKEFPNVYHRIYTPSGETKFILSRGEVISDASGNVIRLRGTMQDVTQIRQSESQLLAKTTQLERINGQLEQFAYVASHDLQEPLRKISTFTTMLRKEMNGSLNEKGIMYLDKVQSSTDRMQRLLSDILSFSLVTQQADSYKATPLDKIIESVVSEMDLALQEHHARVIYENNLPAPEVVVSQVEQLFQNLISNSLKFSKPGVQPEIGITAEIVNSASLPNDVLVQLKQFRSEASPAQEDYCCITVTDNGIGFDARYADRIFQIFQRLHGHSEYAGTGIGLAICKRITAHHAGYIRADSSPGAGAVFTLIIPMVHTEGKTNNTSFI